VGRVPPDTPDARTRERQSLSSISATLTLGLDLCAASLPAALFGAGIVYTAWSSWWI
jgi:hypothetical protein